MSAGKTQERRSKGRQIEDILKKCKIGDVIEAGKYLERHSPLFVNLLRKGFETARAEEEAEAAARHAEKPPAPASMPAGSPGIVK